MYSWREYLNALTMIDRDSAPFPLCVYEARPPSVGAWPSDLPYSESVAEFYRHCDGGYFGLHYSFPTLSDLSGDNSRWVEVLTGWDEDGDVLDPQRHLVIAVDSGGCPVVLDTQTNFVTAFQLDGGTWESPLADSFEAFLESIFNNTRQNDDLWSEVLDQLDAALSLIP